MSARKKEETLQKHPLDWECHGDNDNTTAPLHHVLHHDKISSLWWWAGTPW